MAYLDTLEPVVARQKKRQMGEPQTPGAESPAFQQPDVPPALQPPSEGWQPDASYASSPAFGNAPSIRRTDVTPPIQPGAPVNQPQSAPSPAFMQPEQPARAPRKSFEPGIPTQDDLPRLEPRLPGGPASGLPPVQQPTDTQAPAPPTTPNPTPDGWTNPPADGNWESWFLNNVKSLPPTPESLVSIESQLGKHGIRVLRNAEGTAGKIQMPNGQIIDVILAAGLGGRGWQWMTPDQGGSPSSSGFPGNAGSSDLSTPVLDALTQQVLGGVGGQATQGQGGQPPTLGSVTSNLAQAGLTSFQEQIRQLILQQMASAAQPVDPNDPSIRMPIDAAEQRAEKVRRRRQSADAERLTYEGIGDSGALDTARRQGFEDMSQTISGITAQIIGDQMQSKKRELQQLLTVAMASGDAESARQVQMQLSVLDAELRKLGLGQQNRQFMVDAGLRGRSLDQQQGQFDDSMDLNWAQYYGGLL